MRFAQELPLHSLPRHLDGGEELVDDLFDGGAFDFGFGGADEAVAQELLLELASFGQRLDGARLVITGNAQENAPMIAVNEMLGFEVAATATFWQKDLAAPQ